MIVYKITNRINQKVYIGQTVTTVKRRLWNHMCKKGTAISNALRKYGIDSFDYEIIDSADSKEELDCKEKYYIQHYNSIAPNGYNLCEGGGGTMGYRMSDETKRKIGEANKGKGEKRLGRKLSVETKQKISVSRKGQFSGENNPNYGKKVSDETKAKIRKKRLGTVLSEETRKAISAGHVGKTLSEETKQKISNSTKSKKQVINLNTGEIFPSLTFTASYYNVPKADLSKVCSGKRNKIKGIPFRYVD